MKKQLKEIIKQGLLLTVLSLALISCGKNNKSGSSSSSTTTTGTITGGTYQGGNGTVLPGNWLDVLFNENRCQYNGTREKKVINLQGISINAGGLYIGATSNGDIAVVSNQNNQPVMDLYLCPRQGMVGGQLLSNPIINYSSLCPMGEITQANVRLNGSNGGYSIEAFRPVHIQGTNVRSSLCQ